MNDHGRAPLRAILGPTNTGKTHLAVERMCGHSSGMIGFPLRLLAREVYDRVVGLKGESQVALLTGEEKILPAHARWFLCTAESMPWERDFAFVAIDEAQLGADPERGHVFTDRLLHARGREETMILGSEALAPMVRRLLPKAEVVGRPRFSTLSYSGPGKLSRLPPRSAIVAFSAEQVYAVAEMLRRMRGGAAVVMGALSPRTRNAQVAMYQAGEVDYLVATDAIGMGLNMDVTHVAFAGLSKFDGHRRRRLTVAEMAQIAGRAGRHQRDGTFGSLTLEGEALSEFRPEEIEAIEEHRFAPLESLYWRESDLDFATVEGLIRSLERRPARRELKPAPEAIDLAVLRYFASDPVIRARDGETNVRRLWAACGLPDFRKTGPEHHARLVARIFTHLSEGDGHIPQAWYAAEVARLDNVHGDIDALADRLAGVRTWAYIAHRSDWLAAPAEMAGRAMAVEEKLSDALHERLTQRFVDRRTSVLMRDLGKKGAGEFPVLIDDQGEVSVGSYAIGRLQGFTFEVDPAARHADRKMLLATAERRLSGEYEKRAAALVADKDAHFSLRTEPDKPVAILWRGHEVARLGPGKNLLSPRILLDRRIDSVSQRGREAVVERQKERYGGIKFGSAFFGWLTATGTAVLLTALVAAAGTAVGVATDTDAGQAVGQATQNVSTVGIAGGIALAVILFVAYYAGGYVAGRMARFDGAKQGVAVWLWAVVIAIVVAVLGAVAGSKYNILGTLNSFPRLPIDEGSLTTGGIVALLVAALVSLAGAILGGLAGMRFHRKVDRAGLTV